MGDNKDVKFDMGLFANIDKWHPIDYRIFERAYNLNPTIPVYDSNGNFSLTVPDNATFFVVIPVEEIVIFPAGVPVAVAAAVVDVVVVVEGVGTTSAAIASIPHPSLIPE